MKILHYMFGLPPVRGGGLIRYATDLMEQERKMKQEVILLIPGVIPWNHSRKVRIDKAANYGNIPTYSIFHPLPIPMGNGIKEIRAFTRACDGQVYLQFLKMLQPDMIHIHTLMGLHREFLQQAEILHIPVVFTTHDYFGICPTVNLLSEGRICESQDWKNCGLCCSYAYSWKKLWLEQSNVYRFYRKHSCLVSLFHHRKLKKFFRMQVHNVEKKQNSQTDRSLDYTILKNYYMGMFQKITCFHFNSTTAERMYRSRLEEPAGIVEPVSHLGIRDRRCKRSYGPVLKLGYFGGWLEHKGVWVLLEACRQLQEEGCRKMELHVYADAGGEKALAYTQMQAVNIHPAFAQAQFPKILDSLDILIAPGIWPETFGLVVLEAISCGVPVVLSEFTGARDLLTEYPSAGFIYDGTLQGLKEVLKKIYWNRELLEQANECILQMDFNVSFELHTDHILDLYKKLRQPAKLPGRMI